MGVESDDLRATIESAFEADEGAQEGRAPTEGIEPAQPAEGSTPAGDRGDGRTVRGQFARKGDDGAAGEPAPGAAPAAAPDKSVAPDTQQQRDPYARAPQSWKPGAREVWAQLPPDVRAEVHRRERETARIVQETSGARQLHEQIGRLQQQFAPALQAEGVDVMTATQNLMNLASRLRFGTPVEKAALAAQIIRNYGVDVNALANALDGQGPLPQQGAPQMLQDPRVDQLMAQLQAAQQQRQQAVVEHAVTEVEGFGSDKEFFEDVREDMADLLEVAAKRGVDLSLAQAYERACKMHPEIAKVLEAREAARKAGNSMQSTQRAKAAASSVRGTPSGVPASNPADLRGAIEAAIEQVGGR